MLFIYIFILSIGLSRCTLGLLQHRIANFDDMAMSQRSAVRIQCCLMTERGSDAAGIQQLSAVRQMMLKLQPLNPQPHSRVLPANGSDRHTSVAPGQVTCLLTYLVAVSAMVLSDYRLTFR